MNLALKRIDNLDILCRDADLLARFYNETLGLPFFLEYEPGAGWAAMDAGNLTIYIFATPVGEHAPRRTSANEDNPPGFDSIAFEVEDLDAALSYLDGTSRMGGRRDAVASPERHMVPVSRVL